MQITPDLAAWPPEYTVRKSRQAKRLQLKISPEKGLEVVIPHRAIGVNVENLLDEHRSWILQKLAEYSKIVPQQEALPMTLNLLAIDQVWQVHYISATGKPRCLPRPGQILTVVGDLQNERGCRKVLIEWLRDKANAHLIPWLRLLSGETQLIFNQVCVREQKTRWGSCSSKAAINLNWRLIFLPAHLTKYILIHELCHIRHHNHSARFWQLVAQFDPQFQEHKRELRRLSPSVGMWGMNLQA